MWMRCGCHLLGLCLAIGGAMSARQVMAGFSDSAPAGPTAASTEASSPRQDFTPRTDLPDLKLDVVTVSNRSASARVDDSSERS